MEVNETIIKEFEVFITCVSAKRLSRDLRRVLLAFLRCSYNNDERELPEFTGIFLLEIDILFDLLEVIDENCDQTGSLPTHSP